MSSDNLVEMAVASIRADIERVRIWGAGRSHEDLLVDVMRRYAIERAFIAIGEALRDIPQTLLEGQAPDIPWRQITGFRNWLAHAYDDAPDKRIIETINVDLPLLDRVLAGIQSDTK
jgi:uncharacterized protein with HEPN domain